MFVWHPPLSKIWLIAGIATFGAMCGSAASEDSSGVGILSKSESRELAKRYATYFAAACSVFEKFGLGVLPTESLSGSSSFDFDEAVEELKRRANELQGNDTPATRLELVRLACSSGNFLLAEIHLRQATSTATAPNSQSLRRWRALLAATRYLTFGRESDLVMMERELLKCCDSHLVGHVVVEVRSRRKTLSKSESPARVSL
ncbi:MAG: hypothetical protein NTZ32_10850 [Planctomycetales bacterium]|nr:hypothetical protein [Planctomycetales bacterium]